MRIRVLGCGDAFSSGGHFQTAFWVETQAGARALLDCGATTLTALKRGGLEPDAIDEVLLSHLHGDHFGGLPFLVLELHYVARRRRPLRIVGPPGVEERVRAAMHAFYPGSVELDVDYPILFEELGLDRPLEVASGSLRAFPARHPSGSPSYGLRLEGEGVLAFTGDSEWSDDLPRLADGAGLFLCECFGVRAGIPHHLDLETLVEHREALRCRRLLLTHLGPEAVARPELFEKAGLELAREGATYEVGTADEAPDDPSTD